MKKEEPRYVPWMLHKDPNEAGPWGILDTYTGNNVLGDFLPERNGCVFVCNMGTAEFLIAQGRQHPKA